METTVTEGECTHLFFYTETHSLYKLHCNVNQPRNPGKQLPMGTHTHLHTPTDNPIEAGFPMVQRLDLSSEGPKTDYLDEIPSLLRKIIMFQV